LKVISFGTFEVIIVGVSDGDKVMWFDDSILYYSLESWIIVTGETRREDGDFYSQEGIVQRYYSSDKDKKNSPWGHPSAGAPVSD